MQLMAEAEKKLNSSKGFFGSLFGQVFVLMWHIFSIDCSMNLIFSYSRLF
jgi:hypothetical protein